MADQNLCETSRVGQPNRLQVSEKENSRDNGNRPAGGFKKKDATMNEQILAWPISANTASIIQNLKPILISQEFTKMRTNIEQFSYVSKLVALANLYVELSLPLPAAL